LKIPIIGNERVRGLLAKVAGSPNLGHAYLFCGPDGVGKKAAALEFVRRINCTCGGRAECDSCKAVDALNHPEVLLIVDANKPVWLYREHVKETLELESSGWREEYSRTVEALSEKGYLDPPLPDMDAGAAVDGFNPVSDNLFGKGSVPSRECYTPARFVEGMRKAYDNGKFSLNEYRLLRLLYEYPLSVMPYRGALPIAYVTPRQGWQFTRPIQSFLGKRSLTGGRKAVIIDDAHKMTPQAQNCLLKTLEEPPEDSVIILVTSNKESLFRTIASRCQVVRFERLTAGEMSLAMTSLVGLSGDRAGLIATLAGNCPGRALELCLSRIEERLDAVRDLFDSFCEERAEHVFAFSRSVLGEGAQHRRKLRDSVRTALELAIFWMMEIARHKNGIAGSVLPGGYAAAVARQAGTFDHAALLDMCKKVEDTFRILHYNIDLSLLLDATLLDLALNRRARV
jgi:DNA polymerase-3 subunit delta'